MTTLSVFGLCLGTIPLGFFISFFNINNLYTIKETYLWIEDCYVDGVVGWTVAMASI